MRRTRTALWPRTRVAFHLSASSHSDLLPVPSLSLVPTCASVFCRRAQRVRVRSFRWGGGFYYATWSLVAHDASHPVVVTCSATCSIVELLLYLDSSLKLVMYLFRPQPVMAVRVAGAFSRVPPPPGLYERMASSSTAPSTDFKRLLDRYSVSSEVANWLYPQGCLEVRISFGQLGR